MIFFVNYLTFILKLFLGYKLLDTKEIFGTFSKHFFLFF